MTKEELGKIVIQSYKQGCIDTLNSIVLNIENIDKNMDSLEKDLIENFLKNLKEK